MNESRNYARHVGGADSDGKPVKATKQVVFFSGEAPSKCFPQEHWAFYRRPGVERFRGRIIGETNQ